jgi:glycosyltransferase involved in cell wall biosynthesis
MDKLGRLLVITGNPMHGLLAKGQSAAQMNRYYNPGAAFGEVRLLNSFHEAEVPGLEHAFLNVSENAGFNAWRDSMADPWQHEQISGAALRQFYPGLPPEWLDTIRQFRPDCIRAYDAAWPGFLALRFAEALGVPAIVSVHNSRGICGEVVTQAAAVIAVSEAVAARCIELGANPANVITVHNRVDRERFTPQGDAAAGPNASPKLLCIARENPQKNLERLLQACARAAKSHPELRLMHFGHSERDWSKWPFVTHRDAVPNHELPGWYRWADALVLPSLWEGFGVVLAEALACGTPCITSRRAPMSEIVTHGWDGLLVDPESVDDIARAIGQIAQPSVQARLAAPARTSSERFDIGRIEQREAAFYTSVLRPALPKVSVVLPTYKRAHLIAAAVRNVLSQDYPNLELIVVNDGSPDNTGEVLSRMADARLRVVTRENGGLPRALNTGFEHATGEYWTWTSDDNTYRPGALRALARELVINPEIGLVYADMQVRDEKGRENRFVCGPPEGIEEQCCVGGCFMYRASVARLVGDYDAEYALAEDYDYWLRMRRHTAFAWLQRVLYDYADAPESLTRRRFTEMQAKRLQLLEREHGNRADWKERKFEHLVQYSVYSKKYGLIGASIATAWRAAMLKPASRGGWWALMRALTPRLILNLTRRLRGLDGN